MGMLSVWPPIARSQATPSQSHPFRSLYLSLVVFCTVGQDSAFEAFGGV